MDSDHLKKVQLVKTEEGEIILVPLETIPDFKTITIGMDVYGYPVSGFWVHRKNLGTDCMLNEQHIANDLNDVDIEFITKNGGVCFVRVDGQGRLTGPSNISDRKILIHLERVGIASG